MRVLIVDDQRSLRRSLGLLLENAGMEASQAVSGKEALAVLESGHHDVVITDLRMDGMSGTELLHEVRARHPEIPVILITAYGSIESAVEAMRGGAFDYLKKPFKEHEILEKIREACALRDQRPGAGERTQDEKDAGMVAESPEMKALLIRVDRLAATDINVLISGETGTGKSHLARLVHDRSSRRDGPFVSLNCASVPEQLIESELFGHVKGSFTGATQSRAGLFEEADGGTIFLDEIDTLSPEMQAKLLSVLQDKEVRRVGCNRHTRVNVRVISAANRDLRQLIENGEFRPDVFYRINGVRLHLPPLRERPDDLHRLVDRFAREFCEKHGRPRVRLDDEVRARLFSYHYPGNVRELASLIEQMTVFADESGRVGIDDLPEELADADTASVPGAAALLADEGYNLADSERMIIEAALQRFGNLSEAARELGIGRTTLWRKIRHYGLNDNPAR
ncbi:sigma-54-dependent Fis family transcriptional regulator [Guyparkeria sp. SCN-R1]|nr:sigma-54-dependent Fis family transcriptional regulator [Guyparkeria sp. SCN-R1]